MTSTSNRDESVEDRPPPQLSLRSRSNSDSRTVSSTLDSGGPMSAPTRGRFGSAIQGNLSSSSLSASGRQQRFRFYTAGDCDVSSSENSSTVALHSSSFVASHQDPSLSSRSLFGLSSTSTGVSGDDILRSLREAEVSASAESENEVASKSDPNLSVGGNDTRDLNDSVLNGRRSPGPVLTVEADGYDGAEILKSLEKDQREWAQRKKEQQQLDAEDSEKDGEEENLPSDDEESVSEFLREVAEKRQERKEGLSLESTSEAGVDLKKNMVMSPSSSMGSKNHFEEAVRDALLQLRRRVERRAQAVEEMKNLSLSDPPRDSKKEGVEVISPSDCSSDAQVRHDLSGPAHPTGEFLGGGNTQINTFLSRHPSQLEGYQNHLQLSSGSLSDQPTSSFTPVGGNGPDLVVAAKAADGYLLSPAVDMKKTARVNAGLMFRRVGGSGARVSSNVPGTPSTPGPGGRIGLAKPVVIDSPPGSSNAPTSDQPPPPPPPPPLSSSLKPPPSSPALSMRVATGAPTGSSSGETSSPMGPPTRTSKSATAQSFLEGVLSSSSPVDTKSSISNAGLGFTESRNKKLELERRLKAEEEVEKGVERVLLAIWDRAKSLEDPLSSAEEHSEQRRTWYETSSGSLQENAEVSLPRDDALSLTSRVQPINSVGQDVIETAFDSLFSHATTAKEITNVSRNLDHHPPHKTWDTVTQNNSAAETHQQDVHDHGDDGNDDESSELVRRDLALEASDEEFSPIKSSAMALPTRTSVVEELLAEDDDSFDDQAEIDEDFEDDDEEDYSSTVTGLLRKHLEREAARTATVLPPVSSSSGGVEATPSTNESTIMCPVDEPDQAMEHSRTVSLNLADQSSEDQEEIEASPSPRVIPYTMSSDGMLGVEAVHEVGVSSSSRKSSRIGRVLGPLSKGMGGTTGVVLEEEDEEDEEVEVEVDEEVAEGKEEHEEKEVEVENTRDNDGLYFGEQGGAPHKPAVEVENPKEDGDDDDDDDDEKDGSDHPVSPSILRSLSDAVRNAPNSIIRVLSAKDSSEDEEDNISKVILDKYSAVSAEDEDDEESNEDEDDHADREAAALMRTLCAHLLPYGVDRISYGAKLKSSGSFGSWFRGGPVMSEGMSFEACDPYPSWDEDDADEPGYVLHRLTKSQLRHVEIEFERMINRVRTSSERDLMRRGYHHHRSRRPMARAPGHFGGSSSQIHDHDSKEDASSGLDDEEFERELEEAEELLDREEERYKQKVEVEHDEEEENEDDGEHDNLETPVTSGEDPNHYSQEEEASGSSSSEVEEVDEEDGEEEEGEADGQSYTSRSSSNTHEAETKNRYEPKVETKNLGDSTSTTSLEDVLPPPRFTDPDFPNIRPSGMGRRGELELFHLPIIYKSHQTGFEPHKDLVLEPGSVFAGRYLVQNELGSAAFSTAYRCIDLNSGQKGEDGEEYHDEVCLKVIKNTKDFFDQSLDEIKILELLRQTGKCQESNIVEMKTFFYHREHLIIVTELLRQNLFEFGRFITDNDEPAYFTRRRLCYITRQVLVALNFVHKLGLVHSDVKPENILLSSYSKARVKLIDFGSSCYLTDRQSSYIQSRSYRAPEVVLGLPYDGKIDVWSLGCVVAEMYTGLVTFQNDSVVSMLSRIESICGAFPRHLIANGRQSGHFFTASGLLYERIENEDDIKKAPSSVLDLDDEDDASAARRTTEEYFNIYQPKATTLSARLGFDSDLMDRRRTTVEEEESAMFVDFLRCLLTIDPDSRPTAEQALEHPWILSGFNLTEKDIKYPPE